MKVLAADGYILCRGLVRTLTLLREDVCVVAADSIDEVLACISESPDFDLVLLDASMPGMEDLAGLRRTVEKLPDVPVVVTSPSESPAHIVSAIRNGARGYFHLSTKPNVLEHALPLILAGEYYIPACAMRFGHEHALLARDGRARRMRTGGDGLTSRQRDILAMLAEGKSNKEIAREFKVLEGTVKLHVKEILRKLGVRNRTEAAVAAARCGYLPKGTLGTEASVWERTAANADREIARARTSSPPPQSVARGMHHGDATRTPRPQHQGEQRERGSTVMKEISSVETPAAVSIGPVDNNQAAAITSTDAPTTNLVSPTKSKRV